MNALTFPEINQLIEVHKEVMATGAKEKNLLWLR